MIRHPQRSTLSSSSAASDVYKRQSDDDEPAPAPAPRAVVKERRVAGGLVVRSAKAGTVLPPSSRPKIYLPPPSSEKPREEEQLAQNLNSGLSFLPAPKHVPKPATQAAAAAAVPHARAAQNEDEDEDDEDDEGGSMFGAAFKPVVEDIPDDAPALGPMRPPTEDSYPAAAAQQQTQYRQQQQQAAPQQEVGFDYIDWVDDEHARKKSNPNRRMQMPDASQMIEIRGVDLADTSTWSEEFKESQRQIALSRQNDNQVQAQVFNKEGGTMTMCSGASRIAKRKHQIHSLAQQAKNREAELNSRAGKHKKTKAQTYGRYGW
eukprot:TRINITY_DN34332_c0_g2_i1.p1 TRINITY_DN34332_c0_g2~~TRINITY_DN34332_c0_g2_i1.p1  ORF type:complete len:319 (+),score=74.31 TRINITY_DN34332_c0_g2_i1:55-1011(+)